MQDMWKGLPNEVDVLKDINKPSGEEWEYQDRRQEIVFIGHGIKRDVIEGLLDQCLLTDKELALGPDGWREAFGHLDHFNLVLDEEERKYWGLEDGMACERFAGKRRKEEAEQEEEEEEECKKRCEETRIEETKNNFNKLIIA